jgi:hypothetical protein
MWGAAATREEQLERRFRRRAESDDALPRQQVDAVDRLRQIHRGNEAHRIDNRQTGICASKNRAPASDCVAE